jgi:hypothetical protein
MTLYPSWSALVLCLLSMLYGYCFPADAGWKLLAKAISALAGVAIILFAGVEV